MNWKEFLKPNILKILIFILVLTIFTFIFGFLYLANMPCINCPEINIINILYSSILLLFFEGFRTFFYTGNPIIFLIDMGVYIFSYLISCVITLIIDKVKKK